MAKNRADPQGRFAEAFRCFASGRLPDGSNHGELPATRRLTLEPAANGGVLSFWESPQPTYWTISMHWSVRWVMALP